jgi:hypothetical protein
MDSQHEDPYLRTILEHLNPDNQVYTHESMDYDPEFIVDVLKR